MTFASLLLRLGCEAPAAGERRARCCGQLEQGVAGPASADREVGMEAGAERGRGGAGARRARRSGGEELDTGQLAEDAPGLGLAARVEDLMMRPSEPQPRVHAAT